MITNQWTMRDIRDTQMGQDENLGSFHLLHVCAVTVTAVIISTLVSNLTKPSASSSGSLIVHCNKHPSKHLLVYLCYMSQSNPLFTVVTFCELHIYSLIYIHIYHA